MPRIAKENPIGESIYNQIKDYDIASRKTFFKTISIEDKYLYEKYNAKIRSERRKPRYGDIDIAKEKARNGMKTLREKRTKEEIKEQRKPYDQKYNQKRKLTREEAITIIQRQFRKKKEEEVKKEEATIIVTDILNEIINIAPNMKVVNGELKKKRGRQTK